MKCLATRISIFLLIVFPSALFAGWQVAKPTGVVPSEPFFPTNIRPNTIPSSRLATPVYGSPAFQSQLTSLGRPAPIYAISVSGSLKENIERIMDRYHWKVVWKAPYDYNFDGRVRGSSLPNVIEKLLQPFPLQARMYLSNRTMTVVPRKI